MQLLLATCNFTLQLRSSIASSTSNLVIPLSQAVHLLFAIEFCNALQQVHLSTPHRSYRVRSIAQLHLANPSELAACGEALQSHFANDICNWTLQLTIANGLCKCPLGPHYRTPLHVTFTMEFCNVSLQIHLLCSNTLIHLLKFLHNWLLQLILTSKLFE